MLNRIAVTSRSFSKHADLRNALLERYQTVTFNDTGKTLKGESLISFLKGHHAAIIGLEKIDGEVLSALPELKIISRFGVGIDTIDLSALKKYGVKLSATAGANKRSVAELVIAFALILLRQLSAANNSVKNNHWQPIVGRELSGKCFGIVGFGAIGKEVARLAQGFDCSILVYDVIDHEADCPNHLISQVDLTTLLKTADIISLHLPLTNKTNMFINAQKLSLMKPSAYLINTARGGLVDERALARALTSQALAGAAFDVFANEPPEDQSLIHLSNFFATPHIAGTTAESIVAIGKAAILGLENAQAPSFFLK